jgi:hypothetical protein
MTECWSETLSGSDDDHRVRLLVRRAEEERAVDFVHLDARRDLVTGHDAPPLPHLGDLVRVLGWVAQLGGDAFHLRHVRHPLHEEQRGGDDPHLHGDGEVDEDGQGEGEEEDDEIAARRAQQAGERAPLAPAGTAPIFRPKKSFIWPEKMMTAIPEVKPVITG